MRSPGISPGFLQATGPRSGPEQVAGVDVGHHDGGITDRSIPRQGGVDIGAGTAPTEPSTFWPVFCSPQSSPKRGSFGIDDGSKLAFARTAFPVTPGRPDRTPPRPRPARSRRRPAPLQPKHQLVDLPIGLQCSGFPFWRLAAHACTWVRSNTRAGNPSNKRRDRFGQFRPRSVCTMHYDISR